MAKFSPKLKTGRRSRASQAGRRRGQITGPASILIGGPNAVDACLQIHQGRSGAASPRSATAGDSGSASPAGAASTTTIHRIFVEERPAGRVLELASRARSLGIPISMVGDEECDRMAGVRCQGVAVEAVYCYADFEDLLAESGPRLLVFLDEVADPHNVGAIVRTAEAAGCAGLVLPRRRSAGVNATVMRVSAGAAAFLPIAQVGNLSRALVAAQKADFWVAGLDHRAEVVLGKGAQAERNERVVLVVGSEGEGLRRLVAETCDELVSLPMKGQVQSLNASVAAGVAIYRLV